MIPIVLSLLEYGNIKTLGFGIMLLIVILGSKKLYDGGLKCVSVLREFKDR